MLVNSCWFIAGLCIGDQNSTKAAQVGIETLGMFVSRRQPVNADVKAAIELGRPNIP
jgi:hypothetical protein